jgi:hypothetical protein
MAESLTGMIGKSFEYEERAKVKTVQDTITGTIGAFIGCATWGPINVPTQVTDFESTFGTPLVKADGVDYSGQAAVHTLRYTPFCWFTRVTNGLENKAQYNIIKAAVPAQIEGTKDLQDVSYVVYEADTKIYATDYNKNNSLKFNVITPAGSSPKDVVLDGTAGCTSIVSEVTLPTDQDYVSGKCGSSTVRGTWNYAIGDSLTFVIDGITYKYVVKQELADGSMDPDKPDFTNLLVPATGDYGSKYIGSVAIAASFNGTFSLPDTPAIPAAFSGTFLVGGVAGTSVEIEADVAGVAGNKTVTGNGTDTLTVLVGAGYTIVGDGTQIPDNGVQIAIVGGADIVTNTSTSVSILANTAGLAGNKVVTGNGTDTLATLVGAGYTITGDGTQIVKSGSTVNIAGGADAASLTWDAYVAATAVNTYKKRFIYAVKNHIIIPKLVSYFGSNLTTQERSDIADDLITIVGNNISLNSIKKGLNSEIKIFSIPKIYTATSSNPLTSIGANTEFAAIQTAINTYLGADASVSLDESTYFFNFLSAKAGDTYGIEIVESDDGVDSLYASLGISASGIVYGTDAVADAGTFIAKYTGSEGNTITLTKTKESDGYSLAIYFQGYLVSSFYNYSYNVADANFLGKLIASDSSASKVISLEVPAGVTSIPSLAYGSFVLGGGTDGISPMPGETKYNGAIEEYKNVDLYVIDMIVVSGHTSQSVQSKLQEICEYRKDCFTVVDAPETVGGPQSVGGSVAAMIQWHNGTGGYGRTKALDSKFVSTYFPWISIPDGTTDADSTWYAPSVRVVGTIAACDKSKGHRFAAPAGNVNAPISSINHLAHYLREDDKKRLYADELDNNINPLVYTTTRGFFIDGQKNCLKGGGASSRLNVLRTSLYIKKRIYELTPNFFWKPLTKGTMDDLAFVLRTIGTYLSSNEVQAIKPDFTVTVDQSVNTDTTEAQRGLIGVFEWTPVRSIEKIKVISIINDLKVTVTYA